MANKLPFIISNPHAGLTIPATIASQSLLTPNDILLDSDEQAQAIYGPLSRLCQTYLAADIARAFVDLNRPADDHSQDGVIKTHTIWGDLIYQTPLHQQQIQQLLSDYYYPYHQQLIKAIRHGNAECLIDCHTMTDYAPTLADEPGQKRPLVCLSNDSGRSCPAPVFAAIVDVLRDIFADDLSINEPFQGGFICHHFGQFIPTIQLEVSRTPAIAVTTKSRLVYQAVEAIGSLAKL